MILTFLYHRINDIKYSNSDLMIEEHLKYISEKYNIVVPGDKINPFKINVCLTFDDGFYDFYHFVFPILKKLKIKALLALPIKYILEDTNVSPKERLSLSYKEATKDNNFINKAPFCTWKEINEMQASKLVKIASHSYSHQELTKDGIDLDFEIIESKKILENKLNIHVDTFVYPLGKFNEKVHKKVKENYKYAMRIGSALNISWQNFNSITYRIISDDLKTKKENLKLKNYISYIWFFFLNTFRKR